MRTQSSDTPPEVEEVLLERLRAMGPRRRLRLVLELNRDLDTLALAGIRRRYGTGSGACEERLRLFALRLSRDEMIRAFDWDPEKEGL